MPRVGLHAFSGPRARNFGVGDWRIACLGAGEWALRRGGAAARDAAAEAFAALEEPASRVVATNADEQALLAGGILPPNARAAVRNEAMQTVILPLARRLFARASASQPSATLSV